MKVQKYSNIVFWITLSVSVILIVVGFVLPPSGQIDGSVLTAVGELLAFGVVAQVPSIVRKGSDITFRKGDMEISVDNHDEN